MLQARSCTARCCERQSSRGPAAAVAPSAAVADRGTVPHAHTRPPALPPCTQCPDKHQRYIAHVLGLPQHKVVVRTKRLGEPAAANLPGCFPASSQSSMPAAGMACSGALQPRARHLSTPIAHGLPPHCTSPTGGGFGGKETRAAFVNAAAAVAAWHLRRPVRTPAGGVHCGATAQAALQVCPCLATPRPDKCHADSPQPTGALELTFLSCSIPFLSSVYFPSFAGANRAGPRRGHGHHRAAPCLSGPLQGGCCACFGLAWEAWKR